MYLPFTATRKDITAQVIISSECWFRRARELWPYREVNELSIEAFVQWLSLGGKCKAWHNSIAALPLRYQLHDITRTVWVVSKVNQGPIDNDGLCAKRPLLYFSPPFILQFLCLTYPAFLMTELYKKPLERFHCQLNLAFSTLFIIKRPIVSVLLCFC